MKAIRALVFPLIALCITQIHAQNTQEQASDNTTRPLFSFGVNALYAEHLATSLLNGYAYNYSSPLHMQGVSFFAMVQPLHRWAFGLSYTGAVSLCSIDLSDMPPFDTVLPMQQKIFAADAQYLLNPNAAMHAWFLHLRAGYLVTDTEPYTYYQTMPGIEGFSDYNSWHTVYAGEGKGAHIQASLRYEWKLLDFMGLGCRLGATANYIKHVTEYTGSTSTPWWPGFSYTDEQTFTVVQYFAHAGIDLTFRFGGAN